MNRIRFMLAIVPALLVLPGVASAQQLPMRSAQEIQAEIEAEEKAGKEREKRLADLSIELQRAKERAAVQARLDAARKELAEATQALEKLSPAAPAVVPEPGDAPVSGPKAKELVSASTTTTTKPDGTKEEKKEWVYGQKDMAGDDDGKMKFGGLDFGIGVAFSSDLGANERVKEAILVDDGTGGKIVRVTDRENVGARLILESHYLLTPYDSKGPLNSLMGVFGLANEDNVDAKKRNANWGYGPFVAIQPGEDDVISAIGGGLMVGFRRPGSTNGSSFNIGIGVLYDLNVRLLGEGIEANKPLPPGETEIRYREEEQSGLLILTSFTF